MNQHSFFKIAASLAVVVALGPAAIDMYLASMPQMAIDLNTTYASTQMTLTVFLIFMGIGQLFFGPLSDAYGRRTPLLLGVATYIVASIWAAMAQSLESLIVARVVQGLGASMAMVVVMSMVRDVADGTRAAQLYALLNTIVGLGPIVAPAIGGVIGAHYGWRGVMYVLAAFALIVLVNCIINIPETLIKSARVPLNFVNIYKTYFSILSNKAFLLSLCALSAVFMFLFAYIGGTSYVYQKVYGLSSEQFGLLFGLTSISLIIGASSSAYLVKIIEVSRLAMIGASLMTLGGFICVIADFLQFGLFGIVSGIALALLGLGILEATLMAIAMGSQNQSLGSMAALLGAFPLLVSSSATPIAGQLVELNASYWLMLLAVIGPVIWVLVYFVQNSNHNLQRHLFSIKFGLTKGFNDIFVVSTASKTKSILLDWEYDMQILKPRSSSMERIARAATEHFAVNSYEGASLNKIADMVGIRKASIYAHFASKEELFIQLLQDALIYEGEFLATCSIAQDTQQLPGQYYCHHLKQRYNDSVYLRFLIRYAYVPPTHLTQLVEEKYLYYISLLRQYFLLSVKQLNTSQSIADELLDLYGNAYLAIIDSLHVELLYAGEQHYEKKLRALLKIFGDSYHLNCVEQPD